MNRAMPERRWQINRLGRGLFEIAVDDGDGEAGSGKQEAQSGEDGGSDGDPGSHNPLDQA